MLAFGTSQASQYADNSKQNDPTIQNDYNTSSNSCQVYVMENKMKGEDITFATIAAICIVAGFLLALAGTIGLESLNETAICPEKLILIFFEHFN